MLTIVLVAVKNALSKLLAQLFTLVQPLMVQDRSSTLLVVLARPDRSRRSQKLSTKQGIMVWTSGLGTAIDESGEGRNPGRDCSVYVRQGWKARWCTQQPTVPSRLRWAKSRVRSGSRADMTETVDGSARAVKERTPKVHPPRSDCSLGLNRSSAPMQEFTKMMMKHHRKANLNHEFLCRTIKSSSGDSPAFEDRQRSQI